jgi:hypothetical protein
MIKSMAERISSIVRSSPADTRPKYSLNTNGSSLDWSTHSKAPNADKGVWNASYEPHLPRFRLPALPNVFSFDRIAENVPARRAT